MISADDLVYFLAVARSGRLTSAAVELNVDHTTVGRRVTALERAVGHRLFDRTPNGWRLTTRGSSLLSSAESVESALLEAADLAGGGPLLLSGSVRMLCPDGFGGFLLAPALGPLRTQHPSLTIEIATATVRLEQTLRDFDLAVTIEEPLSSKVWKAPLTDYLIKMYATEEYLAEHPPLRTRADLVDHSTIWYVDQLLQVQPLHAVDSLLPRAADIQCTNVVAHWQAASAGLGVAPLPQFIARRDPRLVRVLPDVQFVQTYWLCLPTNHLRLARVQAMVTMLRQLALDRAEDLLGG